MVRCNLISLIPIYRRSTVSSQDGGDRGIIMTDAMDKAVSLTFDGDIALLQMNRPQKRNPLTQEAKEALFDAAYQLQGHKDLRAVIIAGSGGAFCAGGDLKTMHFDHENGTYGGAEDYLPRMRHLHAWVRALRDLPVPVISAVDGPAFGAGLGLALLADLVIASDRASFNASFCKVGVVPDGGLFYSLPRFVGAQRARELFYTGRTVDAAEAARIGLVMEVMPADNLMPRAWDMARMMTKGSGADFALTKSISGRAMQSDADTLLTLEAQAQAICLAGRYNADAARRFTNKEPLLFDFK